MCDSVCCTNSSFDRFNSTTNFAPIVSSWLRRLHGAVCLRICEQWMARNNETISVRDNAKTLRRRQHQIVIHANKSTHLHQSIWTADKLNNNNDSKSKGFQLTETDLHEKHHRIYRQQHAALSCTSDRSIQVSDSNVNVEYDPALTFVLGHLPALKHDNRLHTLNSSYIHR